MAPVSDACGMAGGVAAPMYNGGEYTPTQYAKQGDLGSYVLKPRPTGIVWERGSHVNVSWYIAFNHGGGYKYRCVASVFLFHGWLGGWLSGRESLFCLGNGCLELCVSVTCSNPTRGAQKSRDITSPYLWLSTINGGLNHPSARPLTGSL